MFNLKNGLKIVSIQKLFTLFNWEWFSLLKDLNFYSYNYIIIVFSFAKGKWIRTFDTRV